MAIDQREEDLAGRAIVVTVIADNPEALADSISPVFASRFEIEESSLAIHNQPTPWAPSRLALVTLPFLVSKFPSYQCGD